MQNNADSKSKNCAINALDHKTKLLSKTDLAYWRRRLRKQPNSPNWFVEISARGVRRKLSLETPNKENAAARARDIYQIARAVGWDAVQAKYRPKAAEAKTNLSVGQFIVLAESVAGVERLTLRGYVAALRRIVSDSFGLDLGKKKFDPHGGGHQEWVGRVDAVKLVKLNGNAHSFQMLHPIPSRSARPRPASIRTCAKLEVCFPDR
jgi:hypothetical protein